MACAHKSKKGRPCIFYLKGCLVSEDLTSFPSANTHTEQDNDSFRAFTQTTSVHLGLYLLRRVHVHNEHTLWGIGLNSCRLVESWGWPLFHLRSIRVRQEATPGPEAEFMNVQFR